MVEVVSQRRTHTRERLVDAATTVFAAKGVVGASVEEICEAAGFTRGAFYSNFDSKDALCLAVLEYQRDASVAAAHEAVGALQEARASGSLTLDDLVSGAIGLFLAAQPSDFRGVLAGAALRMHAAREESLRPGYVQFVHGVYSLFGGLIADAAATFGYCLTVPAPQAVAVLHAVYEHAAITALIEGHPSDAGKELLTGVLSSMLVPA